MHPDPADDLRRCAESAVAAGPPGAHLSVAVPGGPRWDACVGDAQVFDETGPHPEELTVDHAHDLGSVTKIAGTTAMLVALASTGAVTVDDAVGRFLPGLPPDLATATLRDLLTHRAGLWEWWPTYLGVPGSVDRSGRGLPAGADPLDVVAALPLRYPPRAGRHYSDLGFMTLGRVVQAVTGTTLPASHAELVLGPAMAGGPAPELSYASSPPGHPAAASSFGDRIERRMIATGEPYPVTVDAAGFDRWRRHVLVGEVNDGNAFHAFGGAAGHAGLFGTVGGLHALGRVLLSSLEAGSPWPALGGFCVAGPDPGQLLGFRGWASTVDGCTAQAIGHTGFPGIGFAVLPRHRASVVLATNRLHVPGDPVVFDPLWQRALAAAHRTLHAAGSAPDLREPRSRGSTCQA